MDPALAGLLGALVGGAATFGGSLFTSTQQARRDSKKKLEERKVEAYSNTLRSLLRAAHRRTEVYQSAEADGRLIAKIGESQVGSWFDDLVDAEYWLTVLTAACGSRHRDAIREVARTLFDSMQRLTSQGGRGDHEGALMEAYIVVSDAARQDIGFVE